MRKINFDELRKGSYRGWKRFLEKNPVMPDDFHGLFGQHQKLFRGIDLAPLKRAPESATVKSVETASVVSHFTLAELVALSNRHPRYASIVFFGSTFPGAPMPRSMWTPKALVPSVRPRMT